jgi:hypothetical protein
MQRALLLLTTVLLLAACGANEATTSPTTPPATLAQNANPALAAVNALKTQHPTWQYTVTTYELGSPNFSRTIAGTEKTTPPTAVQFTVSQSAKPDLRYVRLGTDIWYDTGTASYTRSKADDQYVNADFQSYYMDSIVGAAESAGLDFETVGAETVSGVATTHYRLTDSAIAGMVANMTDVTPDDLAADMWVSDADGSLMRLAWGPKSLEKAQPQTGFDYVVTSLDCNCPVKPPAASQ